MPPEPAADVPDFLVDRFEDSSSETLRSTARYARGETHHRPRTAPDGTLEAFAMQDEETLESLAAYLEAVADYLDQHGLESLAAAAESDDDSEEWGRKKLKEWHGL
ncbi:hypothetical protein [Natronobeatus ordinarius]|uniref:hypothetical protein n=1 Tax=Natronobeatus ordinarius TaxID=2963433 RepID=UPI0020CD6687|nr:hypothetical protein [Natronobeatus ordinarius]